LPSSFGGRCTSRRNEQKTPAANNRPPSIGGSQKLLLEKLENGQRGPAQKKKKIKPVVTCRASDSTKRPSNVKRRFAPTAGQGQPKARELAQKVLTCLGTMGGMSQRSVEKGEDAWTERGEAALFWNTNLNTNTASSTQREGSSPKTRPKTMDKEVPSWDWTGAQPSLAGVVGGNGTVWTFRLGKRATWGAVFRFLNSFGERKELAGPDSEGKRSVNSPGKNRCGQSLRT